MKNFTGKLVYITGGSSGIGLECAKLLAARGADVVLLARNVEKLKSTAAEVSEKKRDAGQKISWYSVDVADDGDVREKMKKALSEVGAPDILINSAGINSYVDHFEKLTAEMFEKELAINVTGVRNVTAALLDEMKKKKGHVVILSSMAGLFGMFGYTLYAASKAALLGFAESLRYELKPLGMAVTVICPPEVDTPMNLEEAETLPPEGRAMKNAGGFLTPEYTARVIVKGIGKRKFMIIPGLQSRFVYFLHRISNGRLSRMVSDMIVASARKS